MSGYPYMPLLSSTIAGRSVIPPVKRGEFANRSGRAVMLQRLPTDAVATTMLTITGVKAGSEVHIADPSRNLLFSDEAATGAPIRALLQRYAAGSPNNLVRILIVNLQYETMDITYELESATASLPVFQRIDRNYRNPT